MLKVTSHEFSLIKTYIEEQCGIRLENGKEYLIESRLSDLAVEIGCDSFTSFHAKTLADRTGKLRDRIIDLMTTNETLWFRDESAWMFLREKAVPGLMDKAEKGDKIRIWSAAASTGQEAYSLLMLIHQEARARGKLYLLDKFEILGTDISTSALFVALAGRYNSMVMDRGVPGDKRQIYFTENKGAWEFDQTLKKRVTFRQFNLQDSFATLGTFDLILCRYVAIYFSDLFKRQLFSKMAGAMKPDSALLLGATETLRGLTDSFKITYYKNAVVNLKKKDES